MNEDLKPCYDIASDWELDPGSNRSKMFYRHKSDENLYRIVDFANQTISFRDIARVPKKNVIDIYKKLDSDTKDELMGLIIGVIHEVKPITMPYIHEELKVYIEHHPGCVGLLYFKDSDEEQSIVAIKRFFEITRDPVLSFKEISWNEFVDISEIKEDEENV